MEDFIIASPTPFASLPLRVNDSTHSSLEGEHSPTQAEARPATCFHWWEVRGEKRVACKKHYQLALFTSTSCLPPSLP